MEKLTAALASGQENRNQHTGVKKKQTVHPEIQCLGEKSCPRHSLQTKNLSEKRNCAQDLDGAHDLHSWQ
jgi:hypothetical protein